jgi:hypothetical protein
VDVLESEFFFSPLDVPLNVSMFATHPGKLFPKTGAHTLFIASQDTSWPILEHNGLPAKICSRKPRFIDAHSFISRGPQMRQAVCVRRKAAPIIAR